MLNVEYDCNGEVRFRKMNTMRRLLKVKHNKIITWGLVLSVLAFIGLQAGILGTTWDGFRPDTHFHRLPRSVQDTSGLKDASEVINVNLLTFDKEISYRILPPLPAQNKMQQQDHGILKIAIGLAFTSKGVSNVTEENMTEKFVFFSSLLPSFCRTRSTDDYYRYRFYLAYDSVDRLFSTHAKRVTFEEKFTSLIAEHCGDGAAYVTLKLIRCPYTKRPAWSQNDAMMKAYLDMHDYYYRINDDVIMTSPNWTSVMIALHRQFDPPNLGMVFPAHHGEHMNHAEFDFVHRTHVEVFGCYYPRVFTDLYADVWIEDVYREVGRAAGAPVTLENTQAVGKRYDEVANMGSMRRFYLKPEDERGIKQLKKYVTQIRGDNESLRYHEKRVIVMSLYGPKYSLAIGAIRNAVLVRQNFPGWTLRVYISLETGNPDLDVNPHVLHILRTLGAELVVVEDADFLGGVTPELWKYLVLDDDTVDVAVARSAADRLHERQAALVSRWLLTEPEDRAFFSIRDGFRPQPQPLMDNVWAARVKHLNQVANLRNIGAQMLTLLTENAHAQPMNRSDVTDIDDVLHRLLWPQVSPVSLVYDSHANGSQFYDAKLLPLDLEISPFKKRFVYIGYQYDAYDTLPAFKEDWSKVESDEFPYTKKPKK